MRLYDTNFFCDEESGLSITVELTSPQSKWPIAIGLRDGHGTSRVKILCRMRDLEYFAFAFSNGLKAIMDSKEYQEALEKQEAIHETASLVVDEGMADLLKGA